MLDLDSFRTSVFDRGFAVAPGVLKADEADNIVSELSASELNRSRAGARHVLKHPCVNKIAEDRRVVALARAVLGEGAFPFRATLFDKSPESNWLVVWHQDTALPLLTKRETPGWGPWSVKDEITYAHAPATALERVLALRIHLDDSMETNGPLRVIPGTHTHGVMNDDELQNLDATTTPVTCTVKQGGVIAMRPLIAHASSKSQSQIPRRVLHIEYAAVSEFENQLRLAIA